MQTKQPRQLSFPLKARNQSQHRTVSGPLIHETFRFRGQSCLVFRTRVDKPLQTTPTYDVTVTSVRRRTELTSLVYAARDLKYQPETAGTSNSVNQLSNWSNNRLVPACSQPSVTWLFATYLTAKSVSALAQIITVYLNATGADVAGMGVARNSIDIMTWILIRLRYA